MLIAWWMTGLRKLRKSCAARPQAAGGGHAVSKIRRAADKVITEETTDATLQQRKKG